MRTTLFVLALGLSTAALAHDNPTHWIGKHRYVNKNGAHCCNQNDCKRISPDLVKMTPRGYELPDGNVIGYREAQSSEDNDFWRCDWGYPVRLQCFFAPPPGV